MCEERGCVVSVYVYGEWTRVFIIVTRATDNAEHILIQLARTSIQSTVQSQHTSGHYHVLWAHSVRLCIHNGNALQLPYATYGMPSVPRAIKVLLVSH